MLPLLTAELNLIDFFDLISLEVALDTPFSNFQLTRFTFGIMPDFGAQKRPLAIGYFLYFS